MNFGPLVFLIFMSLLKVEVKCVKHLKTPYFDSKKIGTFDILIKNLISTRFKNIVIEFQFFQFILKRMSVF